ncbi:uncharacterized protein SPAPADRAFT_71209 [Spathaspora passalidarum NRRL Y-27907]|uniref:Peptide N-acetyl-beta-D-glucosaminyl asparaginase amidase A N-terminal domain-containing protein n=1 Tax=Spathaspora passalidarum (strain NRRL Y-27907 / 11-Y1) TaxID=619300 RepID=G3AM01_SPAPN|nr:uncharacterized protein SPAPADRAFT_71209 [Spathaspora passalidarum NRRL Y-27907]EGW33354.1 hypothetical protein SPAPADRAFT_71209 [Spathaspora passalidarum NRRL Y-27907]
MSHRARDYSIWNMLHYGRAPDAELESETQPETSTTTTIRYSEDKEDIPPQYIEEKEGLLNEYKDEKSGYTSAVQDLEKGEPSKPRNTPTQEKRGSYSGPKHIIEVSNPNIPPKHYGSSVHSAVLIEHTFGHSWGSPAIQKFTPPDVDYDRVVLTLHTEVEGVQYDRLANLFVNGVQIWRTSTIEPGGRKVESDFKKDVSTYLNLFKSEADVMFQLDNILTPGLTGEFKILFTVDLYKNKKWRKFAKERHLFSIKKPADAIYPLTVNEDSKVPPVLYIPNDKLRVNLPSVPKNTTRLVLSIFTSGNAAEEFWYTNVLDKYRDKFQDHGNQFIGRGPIRVVNVFFNGEKIAVQTPQPVIFTGGISPALWSPVVSIDAFDVPSIDVDVTGLLPLLWESDKEKFLEIEISNGLGETGHDDSANVNTNWITTANLLGFQSKHVVDANGEVQNIDHSSRAHVVAASIPFTHSYQQIISSTFKAQLISKLSFILKNGTSLNTTISSYTQAKVDNVQSYLHYGNTQRLVHSGASQKSVLIQNDDIPLSDVNDVDDDSKHGHKHKLPSNTIHSVNVTQLYPLVLSLNEKKRESQPDNSFELEFDVKIVQAKAVDVAFHGHKVLNATIGQNGTSTYVLSSKGNHGFGSLRTTLQATYGPQKFAHNYKRVVDTANGTIVSDETENFIDKSLDDQERKYSRLAI